MRYQDETRAAPPGLVSRLGQLDEALRCAGHIPAAANRVWQVQQKQLLAVVGEVNSLMARTLHGVTQHDLRADSIDQVVEALDACLAELASTTERFYSEAAPLDPLATAQVLRELEAAARRLAEELSAATASEEGVGAPISQAFAALARRIRRLRHRLTAQFRLRPTSLGQARPYRTVALPHLPHAPPGRPAASSTAEQCAVP